MATNLHEFHGCSSSRVLLQRFPGSYLRRTLFDPGFSLFLTALAVRGGVVQSKAWRVSL